MPAVGIEVPRPSATSGRIPAMTNSVVPKAKAAMNRAISGRDMRGLASSNARLKPRPAMASNAFPVVQSRCPNRSSAIKRPAGRMTDMDDAHHGLPDDPVEDEVRIIADDLHAHVRTARRATRLRVLGNLMNGGTDVVRQSTRPLR